MLYSPSFTIGGTIGQDCLNLLPVIVPLMTVPVEQFLVTLVVSRPISSDAVYITFMCIYPPSNNQALV